MKSKTDLSLIEVWEMKESAWKAFEESSFENYAEYIKFSVKEIKEKYKIENRIEVKDINTTEVISTT